jgi:hypothetical protein
MEIRRSIWSTCASPVPSRARPFGQYLGEFCEKVPEMMMQVVWLALTRVLVDKTGVLFFFTCV